MAGRQRSELESFPDDVRCKACGEGRFEIYGMSKPKRGLYTRVIYYRCQVCAAEMQRQLLYYGRRRQK